MNRPFTIGILGGMGPRATVEFEQRLIAQLEGTDQAMPRIITINDGSIWDRTQFLTGQGNDPLDQLVPNARLLQLAGVDVVCLPCNTAHAGSILARLQSVVPLPIIDMPAACITAAGSMGIRRLLVLGTDGTRQSDIYQARALALDVVSLSDDAQAVVTDIINRIKKGEEIAAPFLDAMVDIVFGANVDGIVLGCTELSFLRDPLQVRLGGVQIIDSTDELAKRCASLYNERKEYSYAFR